jgi:hypothetical protein
MSAIYNYAAEDESRSAMLRSWGINVTKPDATVIPLDHAVRRKPLGLRPGPDDAGRSDTDDAPSGDSLAVNLADCDQDHLDAPATVGLIYETLNGAASMVDTVNRKLKARIVELETENARARASIAELRAKQNEHDFVLERLRIEGKGPPGQKGDRGRDGRDGPRGPEGKQGESVGAFDRRMGAERGEILDHARLR